MPPNSRLRNIVYIVLAIFVMTSAAAFSPAGAMSGHQCVGSHVEASHSHENKVTVPGCCSGMQCCPLLPLMPTVTTASEVVLPMSVRIVTETPLLLIRNIDPPPRVLSV